MPSIVTGDKSVVPFQLQKAGLGFIIPSATPITAHINRGAGTPTNPYVNVGSLITVVESTAGSDWLNSLIQVLITEAESLLIKKMGELTLEVQVTDPAFGPLTWFDLFTVINGTVP